MENARNCEFKKTGENGFKLALSSNRTLFYNLFVKDLKSSKPTRYDNPIPCVYRVHHQNIETHFLC